MATLHQYGIDGHGEQIYSNSSFGLTTSAQTVVLEPPGRVNQDHI